MKRKREGKPKYIRRVGYGMYETMGEIRKSNTERDSKEE